MANMPALDLAMHTIQAFPKSWNQGEWRCGTSYCLAGHLAIGDGWTPVGPPVRKEWEVRGFGSLEHAVEHYREREEHYGNLLGWEGHYTQIVARLEDDIPNRTISVEKDGVVSDIPNVARRILDVDAVTAEILFLSCNTLEDLKEMVEVIRKDGYLPRCWGCGGCDDCTPS